MSNKKCAKWIACDRTLISPLILKTFNFSDFKSANVKVCGLGYYEFFLNGKRVSNEFFKPVFSDYSDRDLSVYNSNITGKSTHTVYFNDYDISNYLRVGENVIAILLGNGFYRQTCRFYSAENNFGNSLIAFFEITVKTADGEIKILSDGTERAVESFIKESNVYFGETHDYSDFDFSILINGLPPGRGSKVKVISPPCDNIIKQTCPNDKIERELTPKMVKKKGNKTIYDAGENIAGFVTFTSNGGDIIIRHAEEVTGDGELDVASCGWWPFLTDDKKDLQRAQISTVSYKNTATGSRLHPYFCWSGFRYFEIDGNASDVKVAVVHSAVSITSTFECENPTLKWLYDAYIRTQLNNMHGGVPSDCPHRERLGYTGDGWLCSETAMLLIDGKAFYEKWINCIADSQDKVTGQVYHTAPFMGGGGGPGGWGGAIVLTPYYFYRVYGDKSIIQKYLPNMQKYLAWVKENIEDGLVVKENGSYNCLGDWCSPEKMVLPAPFVNTYFYIKSMKCVTFMANEIGVKIDYSQQIERSEKALISRYYDKDTHSFAGGLQGADAFAISLGLGDKITTDNLISKYGKTKRFDTGIFGTEILADYLSKNGYEELLLDILTSDGFPSFSYMKDRGATTLWEDWNGSTSLNHPMFGACVKHVFFGLMGIRGDCGYKNVSVCPPYLPKLKKVKLSLKIGGGTLYLSTSYKDGKTQMEITTENLRVTVKDRNERELGKTYNQTNRYEI